MSAPLFLVGELPAGDTATLDGPEGHHAADVQRVRPGERVVLADGRGGTVVASVTEVAKGSVRLALLERSSAPRPSPSLTVVQGIPKGERGELAVQAMTEVGVDEIIPWAATRCVTQWRGERGAKSQAKWASTAREAAKQSRRSWLPLVSGAPDLSTKQVAARLAGAAAAFVLHEDATVPLSSADLPSAGEIALVVGPEGGIADAEIDAFVAAGARPVRLGDAVLRTSTAGVAAIAVLSARLGRW
ncbi:16S rRNA (uracil(1498)-N(3))-methyltransferase [Actinoplanes sp. NBRC 103695]|uniref:16S rRNA (uracil(1498)-N(3))-methyltransferase n=1 Tax=Actinoplanes sp. NBRC 103695 TaxID=3032202 RepID=UPI00249FDAB4|nr:16S rRNA (uracil(1498)-N(3))-methyltransferase [Actinoplanes sp. NBRC 103695]GLZ00918.1 ribosomal RNA small subunit methyltransferase E [Actinoplanes sp. NBRC 103695]